MKLIFYKLKPGEEVIIKTSDVNIETYSKEYCDMFLTNYGIIFECEEGLSMPCKTTSDCDEEEDDLKDFLYFSLDDIKNINNEPSVRYDTRFHKPVLVIEFKDYPRFLCFLHSEKDSKNPRVAINRWVETIKKVYKEYIEAKNKTREITYCPKCGQVYDSSLTFCTECGVRLLKREEKQDIHNSNNFMKTESKLSILEQIELLEKLKALLDKNIITKEEFEKKKKEIMNL